MPQFRPIHELAPPLQLESKQLHHAHELAQDLPLRSAQSLTNDGLSAPHYLRPGKKVRVLIVDLSLPGKSLVEFQVLNALVVPLSHDERRELHSVRDFAFDRSYENVNRFAVQNVDFLDPPYARNWN